MSGNSLPDEIISEILSPALKVSDELFCDQSDISPFAKNSESTSAYLLVCKPWLRVATPLLYNTVVLRSKAQAKALSVALYGNKELGKFIKKLRVEGGYGPPMHIILQCSPNISDLFLSFILYSSDNTSGLCKGLRLINPTRLILQDLMYKPLENKMVSQLVEALVDSISKWDRLFVFDSPYYFHRSGRYNKLIVALLKAQRLHTLALPSTSGLSWAYSTLKGCPLQAIHIKDLPTPAARSVLEKDPVLMALLKFPGTPTLHKTGEKEPISELPLITPSLNPFFIPMAREAQEVQDNIWARILYFAMAVPELPDNPASKNIPHRLPLLLVSKTFKRLGLPHYYTRVVLGSWTIPSFASVLSRNPSIGPRIRTLVIDAQSSLNLYEIDSTIFSQTSGLERLTSSIASSMAISWDAFEAVAKCSGSTLREFSVTVRFWEQGQASAMIFSNLTALRTLRWNCQTRFISTDIPEDGLQNLEELEVSWVDQSFLTVLSLMELKYLERVVLKSTDFEDLNFETFLKAHGHKLIELDICYIELKTLTVKILELCPNLRSISLAGYAAVHDPPAVDDLYPRRPVLSLVKITLNLRHWPQNKAWIHKWERFFGKFEPKCLPNLREIAVKCCEWPTNERDIPKSCWVQWAGKLLKHGIDLTDNTGTKWRPRLKVK
ncbi:hypothetical protein B0H12DRAFT_1138509 [Mycena haematopus]|nr:hypothetical protein B0H12DRAFT_1138509 [Mycena haematopus]